MALNKVSFEEGQRGVVLRDNDAAFAAVRLMLLKVSGCIMEDGSMDVALSLGTFVMDDERRGATRITRLLDKKVIFVALFASVLCYQLVAFYVAY